MTKRFDWIVGIENAFIPDMGVDELSWTGHRARWRDDLALAKDLGATSIRYGITWPEVHVAPGTFDWEACDAVIAEMASLGLEPIWDLVHFGTPEFLLGGFEDAAFPGALAEFAGAFARRYRHDVRRITPLNEPYISTSFRAGVGIWPPHQRGPEAFGRYLVKVVSGVRAAILAIKREHPEAEIWLNDGADTFHPATPELREEARRRTLERYAAFDLLLGLARPGQETFESLRAAGVRPADIEAEPVPIDVIGLDYYPDTEHELHRDANGDVAVHAATTGVGVLETLRQYHRRYGLPLFIAESSHGGSDEDREAWIRMNVAAIAAARREGIRVVGYTWWPLFDHVDWDSLLTRLRGNVCDAGLYHLRPTVQDRQPTAAADTFRALTPRDPV